MNIIKYIFLLLLLGLFAVSVFIATQRGSFDVTRSKVIQSPRATVFGYVNDYRNWENFGSWKADDPTLNFSYPAVTTGKGASYSWNGKSGAGSIRTIGEAENVSIIQKMNYSGTASDNFWTFKDTLGETKVTWRTKGELGFAAKIYSTFEGGAQRISESMIERSLESLGKSLDIELKTNNVKVAGVVKKLGTFYIGQRVNSKISSVPKNLRVMLPKLIYFFSKNNIKMHGRPFVIYKNYSPANDLTEMTVCIPVDKEIFISPGSDVAAGHLDPFTSVKTTLTGDYSHTNQALAKIRSYMSERKLVVNGAGYFVELFRVNSSQKRRPVKMGDRYLYSDIAEPAGSKKCQLSAHRLKLRGRNLKSRSRDQLNLFAMCILS